MCLIPNLDTRVGVVYTIPLESRFSGLSISFSSLVLSRVSTAGYVLNKKQDLRTIKYIFQ